MDTATENGFIQTNGGFNGEAPEVHYGLPAVIEAATANGISGSGPLAPTPPANGSTVQPSLTSDTRHVMSYSEDFPKLPDAPVVKKPVTGGAWGAVRSTNVTEAITFTAAERASKLGKRLGDVSEEQQKCNTISQSTGAKIELSEARDQSLTVLITGKKSQVDEARSRLLRDLQTQTDREIMVPKEFRGVLIGKQGDRLRQLEQEFSCKIFMPNRNENSDMIKVHGPPEFVNNAIQRIQQIVGDLAKQANESIAIPRSIYPWIRGPANENVEKLQTDHGVKINIPPPTADKETIVVSGEREGVFKVVEILKKIYESKKNAASITCNVPRTQHRFILGTRRSGIDEILRETGVVVDVPAESENSDVITLRGDASRLANALTLVFAKATSVITKEVKYEEWQRRLLIGKGGTTIKRIIPNEKVKVDFEDGGVVYLEGSPDQVNAAAVALEKEIQRLTKEQCSEVVHVPANLHRHIVGKKGALVSKLKEDHKVEITIPDEAKGSDEIRVEGKKEDVKAAMEEIKKLVTKLENEKSRDIIIQHRFHGEIIGKNGKQIKDWKAKYPSVAINVPESSKNSDVINLRGDKKEVDLLFAEMTKLQKDLIESSYVETIPVGREYLRHIIGKNGNNIKDITEKTKVKIDVPQDSSESRITVTGKQKNVEKAVEEITQLLRKLENVATVEVEIPPKLHSRLLAHNRSIIRSIEDENGGVHIVFPKDKSSKITIFGSKEHVDKAAKALKDTATLYQETMEEAFIPIKPEYIRYLIGREGNKVKMMRDQFPSVRIIFPEQGSDQKIYLIGKKEEVEGAQKSYEKQIQELNEAVELRLDVNPIYHKHFVQKNASVLRGIQDQNCVTISFPRQETGESTVIIKGSKQCAENAKQRIEEIVDDLVSQVTDTMSIPAEFHGALIRSANELREKYNCKIDFPPKASGNVVTLVGRNTKIEEVKKALTDLIPITKVVEIPLEFHRSLIGKGGEAVRHLMNEYHVRINIPPSEKKSEQIVIIGAPANIEATIEDIRKKFAVYEPGDELRSYSDTLEVPSKYHQRLIGHNRKTAEDMQKRHQVQIKFPKKEDPSETITIIGYEEKVNECKKEIEDIIEQLEKMSVEEVDLDPRFHPRLIGKRGEGLKKIQKDFGVEIIMPRSEGPNPSIVIVSGENEDAVIDCIDKLRQMEEVFLEDYVDRSQYMSTRHEPEPQRHAPREIQITGAPWQLDNDQFPAMGGATGAPAGPTGGAWGNRRW